MAYRDHTEESSARRRRSASSHTTTYRRKRRRQIRFDLIVLAAVVLVLFAAMSMPQQPQQVTAPTEAPTTLSLQDVPTQVTAPPETTVPPTTQPPQPLTFTAEDEELVYVRSISWTGGDADSEDVIEALEAELDWDLTDPGVTVLIVHTHISESYTLDDSQVPEESDSFAWDEYRTDDERYNMIAIGQRVAEILRQNGIQVIHDTTSFEYPNSDYAYGNAREHLWDVLDENPGICLILDLHRDAVPDPSDPEKQWAPTVKVDGKEAAMISMLIGYNDSYDRIWDANLSFAVKLGAQLNHNVPDTFRQLLINNSETRYNQDMGPVTMLIEVGTAGNTMEEALNGAELLAEAIVDMALGANVD